MPIDPNLRIVPLTLDTVPEYVRLRIAALAPTINKIVFNDPANPTPATLAGMHERVQSFVQDGCPCFLVQDTSTGAYISAAKWRMVGKEIEDPDGPADSGVRGKKIRNLTEEELDLELAAPPKWDESAQDMWDKFYACLNDTTREVMGTRPHWILDLMVTDPAHERRGAATMLVQWGCDRADELGIEAYIEASMTGTPMYARLGFKTVKEVTFDPVKEVGRDVGYVYDFNVMIREPKTKK